MAETPYAPLLLDNVSLGSWQTPVVHEITPAHFTTGWAGKVITLRGENFLAAPTLRIGNVDITQVRRIDNQTVEATLPATLPVGRHAVQLRSASGWRSVASTPLSLGLSLYLPAVRR
jgi:hypothetical protein